MSNYFRRLCTNARRAVATRKNAAARRKALPESEEVPSRFVSASRLNIRGSFLSGARSLEKLERDTASRKSDIIETRRAKRAEKRRVINEPTVENYLYRPRGTAVPYWGKKALKSAEYRNGFHGFGIIGGFLFFTVLSVIFTHRKNFCEQRIE